MPTPPVIAIALVVLVGSLFVGCPSPPEDGPEVELQVDIDTFEVELPEAEATFDSETANDEEIGPALDPDIEVTATECRPGAAERQCDDGNGCTDDVCRPNGACVHTPNIGLCDDGDTCTSFDRCVGGSCSGTALDCDDRNACTEDTCDDGECRHGEVAGPCDDGSRCTAGDHCSTGVCGGTPVVCPGDGPCGSATCEPRTGCAVVPLAQGEPCDDGNACTQATVCAAGVCKGLLVACSDDNPCTDDYCDPSTGCSSRANHAACDDGERCTLLDGCSAGVCVGMSFIDCRSDEEMCGDGDACTDDRLQGSGCVHIARACDDGDACTRDGCEAGQCVNTAWLALPEEGQTFGDFEGDDGWAAGWTFTSSNALVGWRASESWAASGAGSLYCGDAAATGYDHGATRAVASTTVLVPPASPNLHLSVKSDVDELGSCLYDALTVLVDGAEVGVVCGSGEGESMFSLAPFEGRSVVLELVFDTVDDVNNRGLGVWVDRLRLTADACR